ncbi:LysR substrate-binding domain-containing protein [Kiloniella sp. b19]|uniref:LysR substrate-binding domain-containing protein n=1 Tax=Kiloniella sp. GXU_MW_B19 TaxID=3141326 RepID=UPI0031D3C0C6
MRRRIPSITALLCFEAAARTENFGQAAEQLNITQSALSRQIQTLEGFVGQSLFTRSKQRVHLTATGSLLLSELSPVLETLEMTMLRAQTHDSMKGALNLGIYPTLGSRWLMPRLMRLQHDQTELTINTITFLNNELIDPNLVDIAIAQGDPPFKGFEHELLMPEKLVVVGSPTLMDSALEDPMELLNHRILQHSTRPLSWEIWMAQLGITLPRKIIGPIFTQFEMLIDAVRGGYGIAIVPKVLIRRELESGELIRVHDFECQTESAYFLLTPKVKAGIPRLERLKRWLVSSVEGDWH